MKQSVFAILALLTTTISGWAHSKAEKTIPANEATVVSVETIEIRFDDPVRVISITLTGPDGNVEIEREIGKEAETEFRASPPASLPNGAYTVDWRGLSADGHPAQGSFGFTVAD